MSDVYRHCYDDHVDYDGFDVVRTYPYTSIGPNDCRDGLNVAPSVSASSAGSKDSGYASDPFDPSVSTFLPPPDSAEFGDQWDFVPTMLPDIVPTVPTHTSVGRVQGKITNK